MHYGKTLLATAWLGAIVLVVLLGTTLKQESGHFFGITDNLEQSISFPYPVEIEQALVVDGQAVAPGTLMLRLSRPDLQAEIEVLEHQIAENSARHHETVVTLQGRINSLKQDKKLRIAALDTEIAELNKQVSLNIELLRSISGKNAAKRSQQSSPMLAKLSGLRAERRQVADAVQSQIDALIEQLAATNAPEQSGLAELEARLTELSRQQENLVVTAKYTGRVGSLLFRPGDQVPAFAAIVTLHSLAPELVKGYIHEDVYNAVTMGQQVWLHSLTGNRPAAIIGTVESLGARIVPYPERLLKNPGVAAWGREVVVRLEQQNPLLLGEKVMVDLSKPVPMGERISALFDNGIEQGQELVTLVSDFTGAALDGLISVADAADANDDLSQEAAGQ